MFVCLYSHNSSLGGRRQKPIGALNSARIGEDAKKRWGGGGDGRGSWVVARGLRERGSGVEGVRSREGRWERGLGRRGGGAGVGVGERGGGGGWLGKKMSCSFLPRAKPGTLLVYI